ncbi:MAG: DNA methyltransferase [Candidatus Omnitrophota bacterium]|jgi:site-specific DNA-methyltransferase (adenine-specific)
MNEQSQKRFENQIVCGNCLEIMKDIPDNSIDACVTDPPAGISFMGKHWDTFDKSMFGKAGEEGENDLKVKKNFNILPRYGNADLYGFQNFVCAVFTEVMRVLKPGGHALVWAIPRTSHHTAMGLERAGFEIRDCVYHIFGSGFPKSEDVSQAIDKKVCRETLEKTLGRKPTPEEFKEKWNGFRVIAGKHPDPRHKYPNTDITGGKYVGGESGKRESGIITAPATSEAAEWSGWGTALKPAVECWWLCRKPIESTVAENVLKWGTGGVNVDGCRVGTTLEEYEKLNDGRKSNRTIRAGEVAKGFGMKPEGLRNTEQNPAGRFPANLILSCTCEGVKTIGTETEIKEPEEVRGGIFSPSQGKPAGRIYKGGFLTIGHDPDCPVRLLDEQAPQTGAFAKVKSGHSGKSRGIYGDYAHRGDDGETFYGDGLKGASRFFYCAKTSKSERDAGLEGMDGKYMDEGREVGSAGGTNPRNRGAENKRTNFHPTVKSLALMRYLITLISRHGQTILDPFAGSGSTLMAAKQLDRRYIGIEKEESYCEIARKRVENIVIQPDLFKKNGISSEM